MKKGLTLLELLVVLVIALTFGGLIFGAIFGNYDEREAEAVFYPERAKARALQEANDLKREELELRRREIEIEQGKFLEK